MLDALKAALARFTRATAAAVLAFGLRDRTRKTITTCFLVLTKTKEPVIEEHVREVKPGNVKGTLEGVERVWRAIESGVFYPAPSMMNRFVWLSGGASGAGGVTG